MPMTPQETEKYFSEYILEDAALAKQLVEAPDNVKDRLALWVFETELGSFDTSGPIIALYKRRVLGEQLAQSQWQPAIDQAQGVAAQLLLEQGKGPMVPEAPAAWAASEPRNLAGVAQSAGIVAMGKTNPQTKAGIERAGDAYNARFRAKFVELIAS